MRKVNTKRCVCGGRRVVIGTSERRNYVFYQCVVPRCGFVVAR